MSPGRVGRFRAVAGAVSWRSLHIMLTNPALLLPSLLFPLFFFTAFAGGLSTLGNVPGFDYAPGYTAFQFVFVFVQSAAFGGVFTGFGIARDFESGIARRLLLAAPNRTGIVAGYAIAAMARFAITATLLFIIALLTGMNVDGNGVDLFGLVGLGVLVNLCATLWAAGIALRFRSLQASPLMQMPVFLILFTAPVYVPLDLLEGWVGTAAKFNPATAFLEAGRGFISGAHQVTAIAFASAMVLAGLFLVWALRGLRAAERAG